MIYREQVLKFLQEKQETEGGYTGNDITKLAELLHVTSRGLRKRLSFWIKIDKEFSQFTYLGKEKPSVTLSEFFKIEQELASNPIQVKKGIHEDLQEQRKEQNQKRKKIHFPENYSFEKNRESLQTIFIGHQLRRIIGLMLMFLNKSKVLARRTKY